MTTQQHYYYGLGRRKAAIARVRLYPGGGAVVINGKPMDEVLPRPAARQEMLRPLAATDQLNAFNVQAKVSGGGLSGWAGAIRFGIARALVAADPLHKRTLRSEFLLTRDARVKERKKPGLKRARKAPQYTKR
ncbi:MAG: 30S ribosomal protein S9 [Dehalococcoidia bacterium]|nr:30S ribosomal protein S9 [Dehalococcoidia bacterium]